MNILLTGASSFTGAWFANELTRAGHAVSAVFTAAPESYTGLRRARMDALAGECRQVFNAPFGSDAFMELVEDGFDVLCHHGAYVANYKSDAFDYIAALSENTRNVREVLARFTALGGQRVVLTGSVFEADAGAGDSPLRAFSPYGLSKGLTASVFRFWCERFAVSLGRFVIPNPFGPYEEPRFTQYLMKTWAKRETASVKTPAYVRDNIHVSLLARRYADFVVSDGPVANPSGYVESQGAFAQRFAEAMRARLGLDCALQLEKQTDFAEPAVRINTDLAAPADPEWDEALAWDAMGAYYRRLLDL